MKGRAFKIDLPLVVYVNMFLTHRAKVMKVYVLKSYNV